MKQKEKRGRSDKRSDAYTELAPGKPRAMSRYRSGVTVGS